ncbi:RIO1 family regulatory kinase/ATPase [Micromonospora sp. KC721]|uniref:RIO1 family regulatory kinase/ATPase domain-containing protein n=1 Tax=Micromonospora sp. KC721 TaxID=2530380 RepID=UPI00104BE26F|nr:RIO1 family regulatory kinase/ATPase [Micromonospora sp. KC721]TDB74306.1 RIO-like kinase [Micromonospora sp. KC721]
MREHDLPAPRRRGRGKSRFDDDEPQFLKRGRAERPVLAEPDPDAQPDQPDRWSSWDQAVHGPEPHPDWLVTELAARDTELGVLKTGKEADVHLVRRAVPGTDRSCLLAVKRYRDPQHRLFHRDAGYLEGRRVRRSREMRAMTGRTAFGRQMIAGQWAAAEFAALARLWGIGAATGRITVPYPVQLIGTELMLEFVGDPEDGAAAPRLAQLRPEPAELRDLWTQLVDALVVLARTGYAHGDLSPYNLLVHRGRLVMIDLPQVVDVVANPQGPEFLARDVQVVGAWFAARGLPDEPDEVTGMLLREAGIR